jgi:ABC-type lipoprotein export system ATPase subunit/GNAT superfamily N-acetyltransferase
MRVNFSVESPVSVSTRARQVSSMFDAPPQKKARLEWAIDLDLESEPWQVGLVVGPSGSGKTTIMRHLWGEPRALEWGAAGVVDDFHRTVSVEQIAAVCQAVGFNTIPAWMRPYAVLSNGEKFRVELARRLLEDGDPIVVDEFTSVVDRQVAQIGAHAVQKYCRKNGKRFVAVTCHFDLVEWLQPDWVLDMATRQFQRRLLQRRPALECTIGRLPRSAWSLFAPYHYLTAELHKAARCYGLWASGRLAAFVAVLPCPVSTGARKGEAVWRVSRAVTLPDWQGLGLSFVLLDALGAEYAASRLRFRNYPAHPTYVRAHNRSPHWRLVKAPGSHSSLNNAGTTGTGHMGGRPCAVFEYCGPAATQVRLLGSA